MKWALQEQSLVLELLNCFLGNLLKMLLQVGFGQRMTSYKNNTKELDTKIESQLKIILSLNMLIKG